VTLPEVHREGHTVTIVEYGTSWVEYDERTHTYRVMTHYAGDTIEGPRIAVSIEEFTADPISALTKVFLSGINFGLDSMVDIINPAQSA
jgi:hypothetical protein